MLCVTKYIEIYSNSLYSISIKKTTKNIQLGNKHSQLWCLYIPSGQTQRVARQFMPFVLRYIKQTFVYCRDPNSPKDLTQFYDGLYWPRYDLNNEQYLDITSAMSGDSVKRKLRARAVQFWSELLPELQRLSSNKFNWYLYHAEYSKWTYPRKSYITELPTEYCNGLLL